MPFVQITIGTGRTVEQKRELLAAVSRATAETTGAPLSAVRAWIVEVPPTDLAVAGETQADRRAAQAALTQLGYNPGTIDGVIGAGTRTALRSWQQARGRVADGYLDAATVAALRKDAGL